MRIGRIEGKRCDCFLCKYSLMVREDEDAQAILIKHFREDHNFLLMIDKKEVRPGVFEYSRPRTDCWADQLPSFIYRNQ
jgi:hypothetical protein